NAASGDINLAGKIAWQLCTMRKYLLATGFEFSGKLIVAEDAIADPVFMTIGETLSNADAGEAIDDLHAVNAGGQATIVESDEAANAREFSVPPIVASRQIVATLPGESQSEDTQEGTSTTEGTLSTMPMPLFILTAALFGFAALLTPCVFPMIPITVSFF